MSAKLYGDTGKYYGSIKHDGQKNKLMHGIGRFVNEDGDVFEGQFKDNTMYGYYRCYYWSGNYLIGVTKEASAVWHNTYNCSHEVVREYEEK